MYLENEFKKCILCVIPKACTLPMIWASVKQPVVLNIVKGFLVFLEGYPFFVMIAKDASWHIHLNFLFRDFFQHKGLASTPNLCCSPGRNRAFSHPYFCRGRINLMKLLLAGRVSLKCQVFLHLMKDETSFCGGKKL